MTVWERLRLAAKIIEFYTNPPLEFRGANGVGLYDPTMPEDVRRKYEAQVEERKKDLEQWKAALLADEDAAADADAQGMTAGQLGLLEGMVIGREPREELVFSNLVKAALEEIRLHLMDDRRIRRLLLEHDVSGDTLPLVELVEVLCTKLRNVSRELNESRQQAQLAIVQIAAGTDGTLYALRADGIVLQWWPTGPVGWHELGSRS